MFAAFANASFALDAATLTVVASCIAILLGVFLMFISARDGVPALAVWGAAYLVAGFAVVLWNLDRAGALPSGTPSGLLLMACGMMWSAARMFHGRNVRWGMMFAGAAVFMAAVHFDGSSNTGDDRMMLAAIIVSIYTFLTAHELWRERRKTLRRWIGAFVPVLHGAIFLLPIPLSIYLPQEHGLTALASGWIALFAIEVLLYAIGMAFVVLVLAQDRVVKVHRTAAETDLLTGAFNRRAFLEGARKMMTAQSRRQGAVAVLLFDLDRFKSINDRFGHAIGDDVLRLFAQTGNAAVRATDIFARFGGEEFAIVLPGGIEEAAVVAERVRFAFEVRGIEVSGIAMDATVSVGAASAVVPKQFDDKLIERLLARADAALYRAKEGGRNRVEVADPLPGEGLRDDWVLPVMVASPPLAPRSQDASQDHEEPIFSGPHAASQGA